MTIEHKNIPDVNLHEPKGVASANANDVYIADGLGSGTWLPPHVHGGQVFTNMSTPYILAATTSYQKVEPIITSTGAHHFTVTNGRLTYTGTESVRAHMVFDCSLDQSSGGARDVTLAWVKNGVSASPETESVRTSSSGDKGNVAIHFDELLSTGDYFEIWGKISTAADVNIYHYYMFIMGMPE